MENNAVLTPEQLEEFDTPLLRKFAEDYARFRRSSPYTGFRKLYRYFEPMSADELPDAALLFGEDREIAYKRLLRSFDACRMTREFDKFFADKTYYWKSATLPKLVILKSWLSESVAAT